MNQSRTVYRGRHKQSDRLAARLITRETVKVHNTRQHSAL